MKKRNKTLHCQIENSVSRIEVVFFLGGAICGGGSDELKEVVKELSFEQLHELTGLKEAELEMTQKNEGEDGVVELVIYTLFRTNKLGFLVQFATPKLLTSKPGMTSYSWGCYYMKLVYGDTIEEAVKKGIQWANDRHEMDKTKTGEE